MNRGGAEFSRMTGEGNPRDIKVLMYHRVVDSVEEHMAQSDLCIHTDAMRQHFVLLERWGFTAITFEDFRLFQKGELNLPKKPVIITFDDGYVDTYELAFPLLQEFGMKAVVFVLGDRQIRSNTWDKLPAVHGEHLMTDEQVIELHSEGFEIGSHTMTHAKLPLLSHDEAWDEISRSRMRLEILLNAPVQTFAFPYGYLNDQLKQMLRDAGYTIGCATHTGPPAFGNDLFEIRRILMPPDTDYLGLAMRLLAPYEYYAWMRSQLKHVILGKDFNPCDDDVQQSSILRRFLRQKRTDGQK